MKPKPKRPRGGMTAAEHDAWIRETGQYDELRARQAQREAERLEREAEWRLAEAPLVDDLLAAGFRVQSAWDMVNSSGSYQKALPILVAHLQLPYPSPVREGIARALAVPEASMWWEVLTRLYRNEPERRVKDGLAVAIAAATSDELIDDVIALVRDSNHGASRVLLLQALGRSASPQARAAILDLREDPELAREIAVLLRTRRQRDR